MLETHGMSGRMAGKKVSQAKEEAVPAGCLRGKQVPVRKGCENIDFIMKNVLANADVNQLTFFANHPPHENV